MKQILLALLIVGASAGPVMAQISSISSGQTVTVNAHGTCYRVTNNGGPTTMIPSRSAAEWNSFINGRPGHISLSPCCTTEGPFFSQWDYVWNDNSTTRDGQVVAGFYWAGSTNAWAPAPTSSIYYNGWTYTRGAHAGGYYYYVSRTNC